MIETVEVVATEIVCCHGQSIYVCLHGIRKLFYGWKISMSVLFTDMEKGKVNWVLKFIFSFGILRYMLSIIFCYQEFYCQDRKSVV